MDYKSANSKAWDWEAGHGSAWARIATEEDIEKARNGEPGVRVTINRNVPKEWIETLKGKAVLALAAGGGQQGPVLSAFGCGVTVLDISERMLERDREASELYGLDIKCIQGDMENLSAFRDKEFEGIVNPVSMNFIEDIGHVFREGNRILSEGGSLIFGIANPALYLFDDALLAKGRMKVKYTLPFSDEVSLSRKELERRISKGDTVEYSHTLDSIIGGLVDHGFAITGFFSDVSSFEPIDSFLHDCYIAIRAIRVDDGPVLQQ